ncbi:DUF4136 domain-containing protein [Salegentibacter chungangensis]|uniref:DUF4136 domain-containing protein n=1 Tax=Salegentibacter chungangensis TaxID=1335724 RepID=A0ABW3NRA5_9FLAO
MLKKSDSYAFLPNKDTIMSRDYDNDRIHEVMVETINSNMRDEGYYLDTLQPDVLIYVHTMFDAKADINANPVYTDYSYYRPGHYIGPYYKPYVYENYFTIQRLSGDNIAQAPYRESSLVIDFINRENNKIIWRGTSSEEIETRRIEKEVRNYVDEIFKKFP